MKTNHIIDAFQTLEEAQKKSVLNYLLGLLDDDQSDLIQVVKSIDDNWVLPPPCPHCKSEATCRRGQYKNIPRFSCKNCHRYWMATHGTTIQGLKKKHLWADYIKAFLQRKSLRCAAQQVGISLGTSFHWRHLLLTTLCKILPDKLDGTLECINIPLPYLEKGKNNTPKVINDNYQLKYIEKPKLVNFLMAKSREDGVLISGILAVNKPKKHHISNQLECISTGKNKIVSSKDLKKYFKKLERKILFAEAKKQRNFRIHLKNVKQLSEGAFEFLKPFRGVSTKYLYHYLSWYSYSGLELKVTNLSFQLLKYCFAPMGVSKLLKKTKINGINIIT